MTEHVLKKEVNSLREEYSKNGVVVIKNVLNSYWLEVLRKAVELKLKEKKRYFDNRNMRMQSGGFKDFCLNTYTPPAISFAVSPFFDNEVKKLKIKLSLILPLIILRKINLLSSKVKFMPFSIFFIRFSASFITLFNILKNFLIISYLHWFLYFQGGIEHHERYIFYAAHPLLVRHEFLL